MAWVINYVKYACIPKDVVKGAGLKECIAEHKDMLTTIRALNNDKNTYIYLIKPSDIKVVEEEASSDEEVPGGGLERRKL